MEGIFVKQIEEPDPVLIETLYRLEIENLGKEAAVNQWVLPVIIRYGRIYIAVNVKNDRIIGVCEIIRSYQVPSTAFILSFYIDRGFRRKGIGRLLLEKVLIALADASFKEIQLTLDPGNEAASRLYRSFGFKRIDERKDEYGRGIHRDLLSLKL